LVIVQDPYRILLLEMRRIHRRMSMFQILNAKFGAKCNLFSFKLRPVTIVNCLHFFLVLMPFYFLLFLVLFIFAFLSRYYKM